MKKILVLAAVLALSACACWDHSSETQEAEVEYKNIQTRPENCDYFDGKTCYRYVRRVHQVPVLKYREPAVKSCGCGGCKETVNTCCGCAPQVKETREPVEIVYKKTTHKTVCDPQTTTSVSYERAPYSEAEQVVVTTGSDE